MFITATGRARVTRDPDEIEASMAAMGMAMDECP